MSRAKVLIIILVAAVLVGLGFVYRNQIPDIFLKKPGSAVPKNLKPIIFQQQETKFSEIKQFLPENLYLEKENIEKVIVATNRDNPDEKQYTIEYASKQTADNIRKTYIDFIQKQSLTVGVNQQKNNLVFIVASDKNKTFYLNITLNKTDSQTRVTLTYNKKQ